MPTVPHQVASTGRAEALRALLIPALFTLVAVAILVALGNWQLRRLAWKEDLIARATERPLGPAEPLPTASQWPSLDLADAEYRPFTMTGHFLHRDEVRVFTSLPDPRGRYGGPGYWIVTPFELDSGGAVLVNRGFAPDGKHAPADRGEDLAGAAAMSQTVTGLLRPGETPGLFTPDDRPDEDLFFARNVEAIAAAKDLFPPVAPFTVDLVAAETPPGGLPQGGETRFRFSNNHLQYALTWYGLALAALAIFIAFARARLRGDLREGSAA